MLKLEIHLQDTINKHIINCDSRNLKKFYDVLNYAYDNFMGSTLINKNMVFTIQDYEIELKEHVKTFTSLNEPIILKERNSMLEENFGRDNKSSGHTFHGQTINFKVIANKF